MTDIAQRLSEPAFAMPEAPDREFRTATFRARRVQRVVPRDDQEPTDPDEPPTSWYATPYARKDPNRIPPRALLFGSHFLRGYVSVTAGAGAVSKSMRTLVDAISMVIGRDLLGRDRVCGGRKRVWVMNLEDDRVELERRIEAICKRYDVDDDLAGLYIDSGRERSLIVARESHGLVVPAHRDIRSLDVEMRLRGIDVLMVDPFVESHEVQESANDAMKIVMGIWRQLAHDANVSIDLTHHIRKNGGNDASIDDVRGGSAMVQSARSVRLISPMSLEDAKGLGIDLKERRRYVSVSPWGKSNFAPPLDARDWFYLESIALDNGSAMHPDGDRIGVPVPWSVPGPLEDLSLDDCRALRQLVASQASPAATARVHRTAGGWFGKLVARHLNIDLQSPEGSTRTDRILRALVREQWLIEGSAKDEKREMKPVFLPHPESAER